MTLPKTFVVFCRRLLWYFGEDFCGVIHHKKKEFSTRKFLFVICAKFNSHCDAE